jgi:hypothetical protein
MTTQSYYASGNEIELFEQAYYGQIPVMLTGPSGDHQLP